MIKKALAIAGAGAILLSMATPVLGWCCWPSDDVAITNTAYVNTTAVSLANSGLNKISGKYVFGGDIRTNTASAGVGVLNQVNYNEVSCACSGDVAISNYANVGTLAVSLANSGLNKISGKCVGGGYISAGKADAMSLVENIVNTNIVGL